MHHLTYKRVFREDPSDLLADAAPATAKSIGGSPANDNQIQFTFDLPTPEHEAATTSKSRPESSGPPVGDTLPRSSDLRAPALATVGDALDVALRAFAGVVADEG